MTFFGRFTQLDVTYTGIFENLLHFRFVFVGYLDDNTRIFGKQHFYDVMVCKLVEADFHTAIHIGEAHFQQCRNQTAGRNIVSGQNQSLVDEFLDGQESIAEIFRILYGRYIVANLVQ